MITIDVSDNENGLSPSMEAEALAEGETNLAILEII